MAETNEPPADSPTSDADAMALAEEAEAEAAEAEALAAAARARARAARLRRKALAEAAEVTQAAQTVEEDSEPDEATQVADEESVTKPTPQPQRRLRLRLPELSTIAKAAAIIFVFAFVGLSVLLSVGLNGYMFWKHRDATQRQQRAVAFLAGARQGVVNMTSLDFNKAKEDVQRVIDGSTGEFRDDFQQRAADFTKVVEQSKVVTEGTVTAAALESMDEHSALVLISATSRVTNIAGANDEPRRWRLRVTVTEDGGQYKMSKVEFVP